MVWAAGGGKSQAYRFLDVFWAMIEVGSSFELILDGTVSTIKSVS
jgi:hypothetical protein